MDSHVECVQQGLMVRNENVCMIGNNNAGDGPNALGSIRVLLADVLGRFGVVAEKILQTGVSYFLLPPTTFCGPSRT